MMANYGFTVLFGDISNLKDKIINSTRIGRDNIPNLNRELLKEILI